MFSFHLISGYNQFRMARSVIISSGHPVIDIDTATPQIRISIQLLNRMCDRHPKMKVKIRFALDLPKCSRENEIFSVLRSFSYSIWNSLTPDSPIVYYLLFNMYFDSIIYHGINI